MRTTVKSNTQTAPWPYDLEVWVAKVRYRYGWHFTLQDMERAPEDTHGASARGLSLVITTLPANSYHQQICETCRSTVSDYRVNHIFVVPAATWGSEAWRDWLMDRIEDVELHEAREFVRFEWSGPDGDRVDLPYAPNHGPGRDVYRRYSYASDEDRRTSFRGEVNR